MRRLASAVLVVFTLAACNPLTVQSLQQDMADLQVIAAAAKVGGDKRAALQSARMLACRLLSNYGSDAEDILQANPGARRQTVADIVALGQTVCALSNTASLSRIINAVAQAQQLYADLKKAAGK